MSDTIEKEVVIHGPRERVWRALTDKSEFGTWFRVDFPEGQFRPGETVTGKILHPGWEHISMTIDVVEVVPLERFSYRWHPYAVDPAVDYSGEPMTLVTFTLDEVDGGTRLRVVESGFDQIPLHRRAEAIRMNEGGWTGQMKNIERHVTAS